MLMKKILFVFVIAITTVLISCGGGGSSIKHGQTVSVKEKCIWASNEETFDQMNRYCNARDERGLELMESRGEVGILYGGESGVVTDMGFGKIKIRLSTDKEVWVASEFIK